ncbi:MAG: hypothetical protein FWH03_01970 [Firmicutes bacterium]|nr:hypothetical protein [Bacillota bacterium]
MAKSNKQLEEEKTLFIDYLKTLNNKDKVNFISEAEYYLLSGLANKKNYDGKLTSEIFKESFLIPYENSEEIEKKLKGFFNYDEKMVCITGDKGNGKSIFAHTLHLNSENEDYNYEVIVLDCDKGEISHSFPIQDLEQRFRKRFAKHLQGNNALIADYINLIETLSKKPVSEHAEYFTTEMQSEFKDILENILKKEDFEKNIKAYRYTPKKIYEHLSKEADDIERHFIVFALFLLLLICEQKYKNNKKYIIVFDNLDVYADEKLKILGTLFGDLNARIKELFNNLDNDVKNDFIYLFDIRVTTRIELKTEHSVQIPNSHTFFLRNSNVFIPAVMKKLAFLHEKNIFGDFYNEVKNIIKIFVPTTLIEEYLANHNAEFDKHDVRVYFKEKFFPFFGNDFREAIKLIIRYYKHLDEKGRERLSKASHEDVQMYDSIINGMRMQFFNYVFDYFIEEEVFPAFGIDKLSGKEDFSLVRLILSYIYWNNHYKKEKEGKGITLWRLWRALKGHRYQKIAETLYNLSVYCEDNAAKCEAREKWSYLVFYKKLKKDITIDSIYNLLKNKKQKDLEKIRISLSNAGINYFKFVSKQFEFFNARLDKETKNQALFLYDNTKNNDSYEFLTPIQEVRSALSDFISGKINKGKSCCIKCNNCVKNKALLNDEKTLLSDCSMFLRIQECYKVVEECVNYINRYRYYMVQEYPSESGLINNVLAEEIKNYLELLAMPQAILFETETLDKHKKLIKHINGIKPALELKNGRYGYSTNHEELIAEIKQDPTIYDIFSINK